MKKPSVHSIIDALGRHLIQETVGVGYSSIRAARAAREFPARWYDPLDGLCRAKGIDLPRHLFSWAKPASKARPSAGVTDGQGAGA